MRQSRVRWGVGGGNGGVPRKTENGHCHHLLGPIHGGHNVSSGCVYLPFTRAETNPVDTNKLRISTIRLVIEVNTVQVDI